MNALTQLESSKPWALVRNCVHSEKCERILVGFSKESLVKVLGFSGSAEAAQGFVYEQPKIFATTRERKCERFVCEHDREQSSLPLPGYASLRPEEWSALRTERPNFD